MTTTRTLTAIAFALTLGLLGCDAAGDGAWGVEQLALNESDVHSWEEEPVRGPGCEKSQSELTSWLACREDADCPCGSRCELGVCEYECIQDADCAEQGWACDHEGQCIEIEDEEPESATNQADEHEGDNPWGPETPPAS